MVVGYDSCRLHARLTPCAAPRPSESLDFLEVMDWVAPEERGVLALEVLRGFEKSE